MKIRKGFVSNSSSSSFVIAKQVVGNEAYEEIKKVLYELDDTVDNDYSWGESGKTWDEQNNYLIIETHRAPEEVVNMVSKYKDKAIYVGE